MSRTEKKYLYDISESINTIFDDFLDGIDTFAQYKVDLKTQAAVERMLMIIGEAIYKLRREGITLSYGDNIINRRNTLAHQYDDYNPDTIWNSVHPELPGLKAEVDRLLAE